MLYGTCLSHYDYDVDYLKDGMVCHLLNIIKTKQFRFGIYWIHNLSKDEDNYDTHIGVDDAEEELKRMEEFRNAQAEVEQKMFKVV